MKENLLFPFKFTCCWHVWIQSYFDNVMTKFIVNNRTDAWKTDINVFYNNKKAEGSKWSQNRNFNLTRAISRHYRINYKFMSVRLLAIKISQWARENFCIHCKNVHFCLFVLLFTERARPCKFWCSRFLVRRGLQTPRRCRYVEWLDGGHQNGFPGTSLRVWPRCYYRRDHWWTGPV